MAVEVDELYFNLSKLLDDICKFLNDKGTYENLSPYARNQADELIKRSKQQLQEISKINLSIAEYESYVDMEIKPVETSDTDKNDIYSSLDGTVKDLHSLPQNLENPYENLPAKDLSHDIKYGSLSWKCKIILKFEKFKRIYAGVHHNWLLIYSSEKDMKPISTFHLKYHNARTISSKANKNPPQDFELVSTLGSKSYYFLALTHKDMLQWITNINRCYDILNRSENLAVNEEHLSEKYDSILEINKQKEEEKEEEEEIYDNIVESYVSEKPDIVDNRPPDLPARRYVKQTTLLPLAPNTTNNKSSIESNDSVQSNGSLDSTSFSEEEEDMVYETFVEHTSVNCLNGMQINEKKNVESEHKTISSIKVGIRKNPPIAMKPQILKEKPKHIGIFKK